jgi:hypothetical protein
MEMWSRDTTKKDENRKLRKRGEYPGEGAVIQAQPGQPFFTTCSLFKYPRRTEANEIMSQGLSLVPIHRDTLLNLETGNGGVVKGNNNKKKKIGN